MHVLLAEARATLDLTEALISHPALRIKTDIRGGKLTSVTKPGHVVVRLPQRRAVTTIWLRRERGRARRSTSWRQSRGIVVTVKVPAISARQSSMSPVARGLEAMWDRLMVRSRWR